MHSKPEPLLGLMLSLSFCWIEKLRLKRISTPVAIHYRSTDISWVWEAFGPLSSVTDRRRLSRPKPPPSSRRKFASRGRAAAPPHSNICSTIYIDSMILRSGQTGYRVATDFSAARGPSATSRKVYFYVFCCAIVLPREDIFVSRWFIFRMISYMKAFIM